MYYIVIQLIGESSWISLMKLMTNLRTVINSLR